MFGALFEAKAERERLEREAQIERNCGNCRFWKNPSKNDGRCHRYPPEHDSQGPKTWVRAWCGEHKLKDNV